MLGILQINSIVRDKSYDEHHLHNELGNNSFRSDKQKYLNIVKQMNLIPGNIISPLYKSDHSNHRFIYTQENVIKKILNSQILRGIVNGSQLMHFVQHQLQSQQIPFVKNYVDFPYVADFFLPSKRIAIQVKDVYKMVGGVENIMMGSYKNAEIYLNRKGIKTVYVEYKDYDVNPEDLKDFFKKLLKS